MQKLLIADSSEIFTEALKESLGDEYEIRICYDGDEALEQLNTFCPHAMIINLHLPYRDGLTVMQEAAYLPPAILTLVNTRNTYIETACLAVGVNYLMTCPTLHAVSLRLFDALAEPPRSNPRTKTQFFLRMLGFSSQHDGYAQLCAGIPLFAQNRKQKLSMELYPAIASICNWGTNSVERSIRTAIENAWNNRDPLVWERFFPGAKEAPSNKAFIARLAEMLEE